MNPLKTKPFPPPLKSQPQAHNFVHLNGAPLGFVPKLPPQTLQFTNKTPQFCLLAAICWTILCQLPTTLSASAAEQQTSKLWGNAGELWSPQSRLPDFSYAGYHRGEQPLPDRKPDVSVKDFGAIGDGKTDDTAAIKQAVASAAGKVIAFPLGRYLITDIIEINHSGTVLQGAGPEQTVIVVPKPLEEIRPNMGATTGGRPTSNYSWSGGIIWAKGKWSNQKLAKVTASAKQGENKLKVSQPEKFQIGDEIRLAISDDPKFTFTHHLYANDPGNIDNLKRVKQSWLARVIQVDPTTSEITLDRSLRTDVRLHWEPAIYLAQSSVEEIGIENLAFEFPVTPYQGHFTELGYNAIALRIIRNSWIRNIEIRHADSGIFLSGANITISDLVFHSDRQRDQQRNSTGHHAVTLGGTDQLLCDFEINTKFIHDITVSRGSAGNVVRAGQAEDLTFDHHKYANHANLYTNIDAGVGTNIFRSGGGKNLGRHCGAWTTWWNIRTQQPVDFPVGWATEFINIVGVESNEDTVADFQGRWHEVIAPNQLKPADLYQAQLERRLSQQQTLKSSEN